jgi:hypothetical protein
MKKTKTLLWDMKRNQVINSYLPNFLLYVKDHPKKFIRIISFKPYNHHILIDKETEVERR